MLLGYNDDFQVAPISMFDRANAGGARPIRWPATWSSIEASQGTYDWSRTDYVFNEARQRGLTLIPNVYNSPSWARPSNPGATVAPPDAAFDANWTAFIKNLCLRYTVGTIEIWNEPNIQGFWGGPPNATRMADLFTQAYNAVRQYNSVYALVLSPGLASVAGAPSAQADYFNQFKQHVVAGADYGAAVHLYALKSCGVGNHVQNCLTQLDNFKAAIGGRRLWVTETGFSSGKNNDPGCTLQRQSDEHASNWAGCLNRGVEAYVVHRLIDNSAEAGTFFEHFGTVSAAYVNKPASTTLKNLA